jgi:Transcription factor WhiB
MHKSSISRKRSVAPVIMDTQALTSTFEQPVRRYTGAMRNGLAEQFVWQDNSACQGRDLRLFFNGDGEIAKGICNQCVVRQECLDSELRIEHGMPASMRFGVYGGMTPSERAMLEKPREIGSGICECGRIATRANRTQCEACYHAAWKRKRKRMQMREPALPEHRRTA